MKIAYFDCFAGISGDMTLGALIAAGADPELLRKRLAGLGVGGYRIEVGKKMAGYIEATDVLVILDDHEPRHHRRLQEILEIIRKTELSERVKRDGREHLQETCGGRRQGARPLPGRGAFPRGGGRGRHRRHRRRGCLPRDARLAEDRRKPDADLSRLREGRPRHIPPPRAGHRRDPAGRALEKTGHRRGTGHADRGGDHPGDRVRIRAASRHERRNRRLRRRQEHL